MLASGHCAACPAGSGNRHEGGEFRERNLFWRMLLRRRRNRGLRAAGGDGVLPLPVLPVVGRVAGQRLHALEAGKREGDKGRRSDRHLPQDRNAPSPILPKLRRTCDVATSGVGTDRRIRVDHPGFPVSGAASCQLRRDGAADARWASEIEGLSCRNGRFRRHHRRIAAGTKCATQRRLSSGATQQPVHHRISPGVLGDRLTFTVGYGAARPSRRTSHRR